MTYYVMTLKSPRRLAVTSSYITAWRSACSAKPQTLVADKWGQH